MSEMMSKPKVLTSDPGVMHKIKFLQFRRQIFPLAAVVLLMIINVFFPEKIILYLTLASFGWYLVERILFRTKNKIAAPEAGAFVSPVDGKVQSVRKGPDSTLITLNKSFLDVVELRLPYPDLQTEIVDNWNFETPMGQVNLRLKAKKVIYFDNKNIPGSVIGVMPGNGIITIHLPSTIKVLVNEKQNVHGGESELFSFEVAAAEEPKPRSILVEVPINDLT
jgi:hypothetical protein